MTHQPPEEPAPRHHVVGGTELGPAAHVEGEPDVVVDRPSGTRSFVYGAKVLATAAVVLLLTTATDRDFWAAFWLLASAGLLGVAFAFIERSTVGGAERISQRRVNVDVLLTVALAAVVNVVAVVACR